MAGAPAPEPSATAAVEPSTPEPATHKPRYSIDNTEVTELKSSLTGKVHELIVGLPASYQEQPERRYPIWYQLDGQWDYILIHAITGALVYDQVIPEVILVGLSYGGEDPDYQVLRDHDYPPTAATNWKGQQVGGGAANFLAALETEIIPLIESSYRADPKRRVLAGMSFGGLFALYALFERPEPFSAIAAASPAVGWDNRWLFKRQREFRKSHPELNTRVWLSVGGDEHPEYVKHNQDFFKESRAAGYRGLTLQTRVIEGERHAGNKPEAFNRAMRFVFASAAK